jgi:S-adenosylhomocysteine hydrolase
MTILPNQLELLEFTENLFAKNALKETYLFACQHVLPSLYYLLKSAVSLGLPSENISVIGKCYSSSKLACQMIQNENIFVSQDSFSYDSHLAFDDQFKHYIENFIKSRLARIECIEDKKIIVLDDGGELLFAANKYLVNHANVKGVEQTSSGYNKLLNENLNFPVVNVARSFAKLNFESPHIAISILNQLQKIIDVSKKEILIIGKGAIGVALERYLRDCSKVDFFDVQYNGSILEAVELNKYDIIIGATGSEVIDESMYQYLKKNVYLISASSSDREFSAVNLRNKISVNSDCHQSFHVNHINLINSGFPLNFY